MLKQVDRVQIAVDDSLKAEQTLKQIFAAEVIRRDEVRHLAAKRTTMQAGSSLFELLGESAAGPVADYLRKWGPGLFGAGFSVEDLDRAAAFLAKGGVGAAGENGQILIDPSSTFGMPVVLSARHDRSRVGDAITHVYEVTNCVRDAHAAGDRYAKIFGLKQSKYVPIESAEFGYAGALTMFDSPARLDRIEIAGITDPSKPMGRYHSRRGDSLYMFFVETDNTDALADRLLSIDAPFAPWTKDARGLAELFIHPSAMCGVLVGVSRTEHAWKWSGDSKRSARAALPR
jgi:hypothetical protein